MSVLDQMLVDHPGLEALLASVPLSPEQVGQLERLVEGVRHYRRYREATGGRLEKPRTPPPLQQRPQHRSLSLRGVPPERAGRFALSQGEIDDFRARGVAGPFPLLSSGEAAELRRYVLQRYEEDFGGNTTFSDEIRDVLKRHGAWRINAAGLYQALFDPVLWDLHSRTEITDRLACLLGEDILCWRSQIFESVPGNPGTFWHQASRFREQAEQPKLLPPPDLDDAMIQLTAWVALEPVTIKNSCLRFLAGSFCDGRIEHFTYSMFDELIGYLHDKPDERVREVLRLMLFQSNIFKKCELAFHEAVRIEPTMFEGYELLDMELEAGEFVIFTSMNLHASRANRTDRARLALAGRYTTNDVRVLPDMDYEPLSTPEGVKPWPLDRVASIQVRGHDRTGFNRIAVRPG